MTNTRVNELDLLRFIAAMSVVFFHYIFRGPVVGAVAFTPYPLLAEVAKYGYLGVQLFFMISGFVILMTAARGSLREFVISRTVRLYPAFWACCTLSLLAAIAFGQARYSASLGQYLANLTMLNGFVGVRSIDGVYWSLFVELRFYALVAVVLLLGKIQKAEGFLVFWLIASVALQFCPVSKLRFLLITDFASFFIAGAACFLILAKGVSLTRVALVVISWILSVFQSIREMRLFEAEFHTQMNGYLVTGAITAFFVVMMAIALRRTGCFGRTRWLLAGALTYPLYLLHQNIGLMMLKAGHLAINQHLLFWGTIASALTLAYLVHKWIEKPFSKSMKTSLNRLADGIQRLRASAKTAPDPQTASTTPERSLAVSIGETDEGGLQEQP